MMQDPNQLLERALSQLGREQGDPSLIAHSMFRNGTHLKGTDDEEPHNMNPVLFVDEYGREIKGSMSAEDASRPGMHTPEAVESGAILDDSNMMDYPTEDDSLSFLKLFVNDDMARTNNIPDYVMDSLKRQYKGGSDYTIEDKKNVIDHYMNQRMRA